MEDGGGVSVDDEMLSVGLWNDGGHDSSAYTTLIGQITTQP